MSQSLGEDAVKFIEHFLGYTGRAVDPTPFDVLFQIVGKNVAYQLILSNLTGVMAAVGLL